VYGSYVDAIAGVFGGRLASELGELLHHLSRRLRSRGSGVLLGFEGGAGLEEESRIHHGERRRVQWREVGHSRHDHLRDAGQARSGQADGIVGTADFDLSCDGKRCKRSILRNKQEKRAGERRNIKRTEAGKKKGREQGYV